MSALTSYEGTMIKNLIFDISGVFISSDEKKILELYAKKLNQPELAKSFYEQIIFNHPDSIYFVEARKNFRALRGDAIN